MNARLKINMLEVTRLTRDGRLARGDGSPARRHPQSAIIKFGGKHATRV